MKTMILGLLFVMSLALTVPAGAHTDEYFESVQAPHGGQLRMTGPYHMELLAKDGAVPVVVARQQLALAGLGDEVQAMQVPRDLGPVDVGPQAVVLRTG